MIYAVIDTNVLVSAMITKNPEAATAKVVRLLLDKEFIPMYDADIIAEYEDVLHRSKFPILPEVADALISYIIEHGVETSISCDRKLEALSHVASCNHSNRLRKPHLLIELSFTIDDE